MKFKLQFLFERNFLVEMKIKWKKKFKKKFNEWNFLVEMKIFLIERNVSQWFLTLAFRLSKTKIYKSLVSVVLVLK
jgi:hypothetical protein